MVRPRRSPFFDLKGMLMELNETPDPYKALRLNVSRAISERSSVVLNNVEDVDFAIGIIGPAMKSDKLSYRVRTSKRSAMPATAAGSGAAIIGASVALEATAIAAPIVVGTVAMAGAALTGVGAVVLAGIAIHRIATRNPDYEIVVYSSAKEIHLLFKK